MQLKTVTEKTKPLAIDVDGEVLNVTYRPNALLTKDVFGTVTTADDFIDQCCRFIASWDLLDGSDTVPLTPEALAGVPAPFLRQVLEACVDDTQGPPTPGSS